MHRRLLSAALLVAFALPACDGPRADQTAPPTAMAAGPAATPAPAQPPLAIDVMREPGKIPPSPPNYDGAPPALREFLLKAKAANAITDRLQRCLAFPTLPDTHWPKQLEVQHCQYMFGPRPGFKAIRSYVNANDIAGLEAILRKLLDRHFSESDFSEGIHAALAMPSGAESNRVTKRWLELAPHSAYAMTARAEYFKQTGWTARGDQFTSETPAEQLAKMAAFHQQAAMLYRKAIKKEPRMMPAYTGLVDIGRSGAVDTAGAFEQGRTVDPGCRDLIGAQMITLQPRWGGGWEEMEALGTEIRPLLAKRPLLAVPLSYRQADIAATARSNQRPDEEVATAQAAIADSTNPYLLEDAAYGMYDMRTQEPWVALSYLVAASRYRPDPFIDLDADEFEADAIASAAAVRGTLYESTPHDYEAANHDFAIWAKLQPNDAAAHFHYAENLNRLIRPVEAEREYLLAERFAQTENDKAQALDRLAAAQASWGKFDKAIASAQRVVADHPTYARGWVTLYTTFRDSNAPVAQQRAALESYLRVVDRTDPGRAGEIGYVEQALRDLNRAHPPTK
jgi:tetratricopeptide (TPR) repeat protein